MNQNKKFDIALSFAGEEREYVDRIAKLLKQDKISVFYDLFEETNLWGKNLYDYLSDIYKNQARYTIIFISENYIKKLWTNHERQSMQARAFQESEEYILPVRFDDTVVPGISNTVGYIDLRTKTPEELVEKIKKKLGITTDNKRSKDKLLIYVSYGGTCRDPMAVVITQSLIREKKMITNLNIKGMALSEFACDVSDGAKFAIKSIYKADLFSGYQSETITKEICDEADLILVMSEWELSQLLNKYPNAVTKSYVFKDFFGLKGDIDDPFYKENEIYLDCAKEMKEIITKHFDCLINKLTAEK